MNDSADRELAQRREWERYFRDGYLWSDAEWVRDTPDGFTYWPGRLAQHFCVEEIVGGDLTWRWRMPMVHEVTRPDLAPWLCLRLNEFACGWSFVYEPERSSVSAIAAMSAPIGWDRYLVRFATGAKLAGWLCETVVDDLARRLGGTPSLAVAPGGEGLRTTPDALAYLPTALRERPEWVFDPTPYRFGSLDDIARLFIATMGEVAHRSEVDDDGFSVTTLQDDGQRVSSELRASFATHPLFGESWCTDVALPWVLVDRVAAAATTGARQIFDAPIGTLMGAFVEDAGSLVYRQWATTGELRSYEQLPSFQGHGADVLWGVSASSSDALTWAVDADWPTMPGGRAPADLEESLAAVTASIAQGGRVLAQAWPPREGGADRRRLWWPQLAVLIVAGWFNPMGPTLSTLELRRDPTTGRVRLLWFQRHPFRPQYVDLGPCETDAEMDAALAEGMERLCEGSLANIVSLASCPEDLVDRVVLALRRATDERVRQSEESYAGTASRIRDTLGQPWAYAGGPREGRFDAEVSGRPPIPADAGFIDWFGIAVDDLNVAATLNALPDAWDGSLNFQRSAGNLDARVFDLGPFLLLYSSIGSSEPDAAD